MGQPIFLPRNGGLRYGTRGSSLKSPFPLAPDEGLDPNLGESSKTWDDRSLGMCDVPNGGRNNRTPPIGL